MVELHQTSSGLGTWRNHRSVGVFDNFGYFAVTTLRFLRAGCIRWRPYRVECTGSLLTSEVKRRRARLVLGWGTAWEDLRVLPAFANPREKLAGSIFSLDFDWIFQLNPQIAIFSDGKFNFPAGKKPALSTGLRKLHSLAAIPRRMHQISSDLRS